VLFHTRKIAHGGLNSDHVVFSKADKAFHMVGFTCIKKGNFEDNKKNDINLFCNTTSGVSIFAAFKMFFGPKAPLCQALKTCLQEISAENAKTREVSAKTVLTMYDAFLHKQNLLRGDDDSEPCLAGFEDPKDPAAAFVPSLRRLPSPVSISDSKPKSINKIPVKWILYGLYNSTCVNTSNPQTVSDYVFSTKICTSSLLVYENDMGKSVFNYVYGWAQQHLHSIKSGQKLLKITGITVEHKAYNIHLNNCTSAISFQLDTFLHKLRKNAPKTEIMKTELAKMLQKTQFTDTRKAQNSEPLKLPQKFAKRSIKMTFNTDTFTVRNLYKPADQTDREFVEFLLSNTHPLEFETDGKEKSGTIKVHGENARCLHPKPVIVSIMLQNASKYSSVNPNAEAYAIAIRVLQTAYDKALKVADCTRTDLEKLTGVPYKAPQMALRVPTSTKQLAPDVEDFYEQWMVGDVESPDQNFQKTVCAQFAEQFPDTGNTDVALIPDYIALVVKNRWDLFSPLFVGQTVDAVCTKFTTERTWNSEFCATVLCRCADLFHKLFIYDHATKTWISEPTEEMKRQTYVILTRLRPGHYATLHFIGHSKLDRKTDTPKQLGLIVVDAGGGGNCLYLAFQSAGIDAGVTDLQRETHKSLRRKTVEFERTFKNRLSRYWPQRGYTKRVNQQARPGEWGDNLEAQVLGYLFNVDVAIYDSINKKWSQEPPQNANSPRVYLHFTGGCHYQAYHRKTSYNTL